ncbi:hypothetical protein [Plasmodium yoelii yoelii]|uniref:Uncharacterized protein n=1 Tax=Plasmodium yoelii yoelii TaxID=73239 RepID=Q7REA1_PLAYO|nr:hypothetical protein [Plasmodium yoelii yoelii]
MGEQTCTQEFKKISNLQPYCFISNCSLLSLSTWGDLKKVNLRKKWKRWKNWKKMEKNGKNWKKIHSQISNLLN